jgi:hypothetical protein
MKYLFALVVLLLVGAACGALVQFNSSVDCHSNVCDLSNPQNWINNVVPSVNDTVQIIPSLEYGTQYYFTASQPTIYANLLVQNINIAISALFQVSYSSTITNTTIIIASNATLTLNYTSFVDYTTIDVQNGTLTNNVDAGTVYFDFETSLVIASSGSVVLYAAELVFYANLTTVALSTLSLYSYNLTFAPGYTTNINCVASFWSAVIPNNANYYFMVGALFGNLTIGYNSTITVYGHVDILNVYNVGTPALTIYDGGILNLINLAAGFYYSTVSLPSGSTTGTIKVVSSYVTFYGANNTLSPAIPISFAGSSTAWFYNSVIQNISFSPGAYVQIISNSNLTLVNNQLTRTSILGNINLMGGVLNLNGNFYISAGIVAYNYATINSTSSVLTTDVTLYSQDSSLNVLDNLQIDGNFINQGTVQISENKFLFVNGQYSQNETANLVLLGLDSTANSTFNSSARLSVSNAATAYGYVKYSYTNIPLHAKYLIFEAPYYLGQFSQKATALAGSITTLDFEFSPKTVYLVYNSSSPMKWGPLVWYYWLAIGAGALILIVLIVGIVVKRSRRKGYSAVILS